MLPIGSCAPSYFLTILPTFLLVSRAGGPINDESNTDLLRVPPLSVPLCQRIVERLEKEGDGGTKVAQLQGELFAVSAKANEEALELVCFDVLTMTESASSGEFIYLLSFCYAIARAI